LTTLVGAGMARTEAYPIVQRNALRAFDERTEFRTLVEADPEVTAALDPDQIAHCFDDRAWLTHVGEIITRLERLDP
jgi:adenylosuccinate lyase